MVTMPFFWSLPLLVIGMLTMAHMGSVLVAVGLVLLLAGALLVQWLNPGKYLGATLDNRSRILTLASPHPLFVGGLPAPRVPPQGGSAAHHDHPSAGGASTPTPGWTPPNQSI